MGKSNKKNNNVSVYFNDHLLHGNKIKPILKKTKYLIPVSKFEIKNSGFYYFKKPVKFALLKYIFFGALIGAINGFWGGGGGMVCVPALTGVFKLKQKNAQATAMFVILPISLLSFIIYYLKGGFNFDNVLLIGTLFTIGGLIGALGLKKVNNNVLKVVFSVLIIVAGVRMLFK